MTQSATLHSVAHWCIAVGRPAYGSCQQGLAPCDSGSSRNLRDYESASTWITLSFMHQNLCCPLMPRPKLGGSRPTTAAAAPAAFRLVHLQVVGREQMAIAAYTGYGHALADTFRRKGHDVSFGCSKARPRYQFQRFAPSCTGLPRQTAFLGSPRPIVIDRTMRRPFRRPCRVGENQKCAALFAARRFISGTTVINDEPPSS